MRPTIALSLDEITIHYAERPVVERLTLHVHRGEIFGLLGPNGSGKSSTLSAAAGVISPIHGRVTVEGICRREQPAAFAARVGLVPQELAVYEELTARDNLTFFGRLHGLSGRHLRRQVDFVLQRVELADRAHEQIAQFSGGMKQRLNLAVALLHDPAVLLLDEPTVALDPASRDCWFATLHQLRDEGRAILLTTHLLDEAEQWCDRIGILQHGILTAVGRPQELVRPMHAESLMYGHLRSHLAGCTQRTIQESLPPGIEFDVTGRRVRLAATSAELLGHALSVLLSHGIEFASFRTPPAGLERLLRGAVTADVPPTIRS